MHVLFKIQNILLEGFQKHIYCWLLSTRSPIRVVEWMNDLWFFIAIALKFFIAYYNGYLFAARNQTRPREVNNTGNTLYGAGMAQNQPPLCYPAMLNPYPIYQNPVAGTSNHLQFEPDMDSVSPTPSESSNRSDDRNKRSSWSLTEERCLIASYNE